MSNVRPSPAADAATAAEPRDDAAAAASEPREAAVAAVREPTPDVAAAPSASRGYTATKGDLRARLRRIEGQIRGISAMVEEDRYCIDVLTQISAARAALDKVALGLLDDHAHHCVLGAETDAERAALAGELMDAVGRLVRR